MLALLSLAACADPAPNPEDAFATGPVVGAAPSGSQVAAIWVVNEGEDYAYKFGGGAVAGSSFSISFDGEVPGDALTSEGWGYAYLVLVDQEVPDFTRLEESTTLFGIDVDHAIVFRGPNATPSLPWVAAFPQGLSCGVCRRFEDQERQDELSPTTCNTVSMTVGDLEQLRGCNLD